MFFCFIIGNIRREFCKEPMKNSKKTLSAVLACFAAVCLVAFIVSAVRQFSDDRRSEDTLNPLRDSAAAYEEGADNPEPDPTPSPIPSPSPESTPTPTATPGPTPAPVVNPYRDSYLANSDMAAWLKIPDTVVDYPVMWTPADENYYLKRGFDGSSNQNGCLILDTDSSLEPLTTNLIIHGHNMKSGAMFGTLTKYESEEYFHEHPDIILYTLECQKNYKVLAVFRSQVFKKKDTVFKYYKFFQADSQEEFDDFYNNIMDMSLYDTGVTAEFGDHFLTLSTCAYHVEQGRFVVVAKEVEGGDSYLPLEGENNIELSQSQKEELP